MPVDGILYALIATLGFAVMGNIKGRKVLYAGLGGGLSWAVYLAGASRGFSDPLAVFLATVAVGLAGEALGRAMRTPAIQFLTCAVIPLVPGKTMYDAMFAFVRGNYALAADLSVTALIVAGSIAVGIAVISSLVRASQWFRPAE